MEEEKDKIDQPEENYAQAVDNGQVHPSMDPSMGYPMHGLQNYPNDPHYLTNFQMRSNLGYPMRHMLATQPYFLHGTSFYGTPSMPVHYDPNFHHLHPDYATNTLPPGVPPEDVDFDFFPAEPRNPMAEQALTSAAIKKIPGVTYRRGDCTWVAKLSPERRGPHQTYKYFNARKIGFYRAYAEAVGYKWMAENSVVWPTVSVSMEDPEDIEATRMNLPKVECVFLRSSDMRWVCATRNLIEDQVQHRFFSSKREGVIGAFWRALAFTISIAAARRERRPAIKLKDRKRCENWFELGLAEESFFVNPKDHISWVARNCDSSMRGPTEGIQPPEWATAHSELRELFADLEKAPIVELYRASGGRGPPSSFGPEVPQPQEDNFATAANNQRIADGKENADLHPKVATVPVNGFGGGGLDIVAGNMIQHIFDSRDNRIWGIQVGAGAPHFPKVDGLAFDDELEAWVDSFRTMNTTWVWEISRWGLVGGFKAAMVHRKLAATFEKYKPLELLGSTETEPATPAVKRKRGRKRLASPEDDGEDSEWVGDGDDSDWGTTKSDRKRTRGGRRSRGSFAMM